MSVLIAPRLCGYCHEPFTPTKPARLYCSKVCSGRGIGYGRRGTKWTAKAISTRKERAAERAADALAAEFGVLSEREIALYAAATAVAYQRGYSTARYTLTRKRKAA